MLCRVCGNEFNEKRYLKDLFRVKKFYICDLCLKKYPISLEFIKLPLAKNHQLEIISLFKNQIFNYSAYFNEYSKIYQNLLITHKYSLIIPEEKFIITEEKMEHLDYISTLLDKDIIILTNIFLD